jgi:hypothetical protein
MNQHRLPDQIPPPQRTANAPTAAWTAWVRQQWGGVRVTHLEANPLFADVPGQVRVRANVHLVSLLPADVLVELTGTADAADASGEWPIRLCSVQSYNNGSYVFEGLLPLEAVDDHLLIVRVRPSAVREALSGLQEVSRPFDVRLDSTAPVGTAGIRDDESRPTTG